MFNSDINNLETLGGGITSSINVLYDLDSAQEMNSWEWNSNPSTASSNNSPGQPYFEPAIRNENGDQYQQSLDRSEPVWNASHSSMHQNYEQHAGNHNDIEHYGNYYTDSNRQERQMQPPHANFYPVTGHNHNQQANSSTWLHAGYTQQPIVKGNNVLQHGVHLKNAHQNYGSNILASNNFKILPSKKTGFGNVGNREYSQMGQKGFVTGGFMRQGIIEMNPGQQQVPLLGKRKQGEFGHGLVRVANDYFPTVNKHPKLTLRESPFQQFSPTAIELISLNAAKNFANVKSPVSPRVIEVKTVPIRNTIFGYKKLKFRCMKCGNRDATYNSQLTHVKSHLKPYCPQCCWVGDHILQVKAHMEKAHPKPDMGSGVTMMTSKYGRKRHVNTSVAIGLKKKKTTLKIARSVATDHTNDIDQNSSPQKEKLLEIKTEPIDSDDQQEAVSEIEIPEPARKWARVKIENKPKAEPKLASAPTKKLSKRQQSMKLKKEKTEDVAPPEVKVEPQTVKVEQQTVKVEPDEDWVAKAEQKVPRAVRKVPKAVREVPKNVKAMPKNVKAIPKNVKAMPKNVKAMPKNVKAMPKNVKAVLKEVREMPKRGQRKKK